MTSFDNFSPSHTKLVLGFEEALKQDEMHILGDCKIATLSPLKFRVLTDPNKPRKIQKDGKAVFSVGGVELYSGDAKITNPLEQNIALFLMLYGEWPSESEKAEIENNQLIAFDFVSEPEETHPESEVPFVIIGTLSGMVSRRFNSMVFSDEGKLERLSPKTSDIGNLIPEDYKGEVLPLWRFVVKPQ
jgi:hypothetical protein